jgi:hypothetical protein
MPRDTLGWGRHCGHDGWMELSQLQVLYGKSGMAIEMALKLGGQNVSQHAMIMGQLLHRT